MSKQQYKSNTVHNGKATRELHEYEIAKVRGRPDREPDNPFSQHEIEPTLSAEDIQHLIGAHKVDHVDHAKD